MQLFKSHPQNNMKQKSESLSLHSIFGPQDFKA